MSDRPDQRSARPPVQRGIRYGSEDYRGLVGQLGPRPDPPETGKARTEGRGMRATLFTFRYALPFALCAFGTVYAIVDWEVGSEAFSLFTGAGLSILLLNVLFRIGVSGEAERDREEAAREYFTEHGRWPDDD